VLHFNFKLDTSITQPSVAFLSKEYYYTNGVDTKITAEDGTVLTPEINYQGNFLSFAITDEKYNGKLIDVVISATN